MSPKICPYLGLRDDADTALEFASRGNHCFHVRPIAAVQPEHQREYCLDKNHVACPVFQRSELMPLPPEIQHKPGIPPVVRWAAIGALAVALMVALFSWIGLGDVLAELSQPPSADEVAEYQRSPLMVATLTPTQTKASDLFFMFTVSPNPTFVACSPPSGWEVYVAKPTDSLLRLSIIYQVTVEDLQSANCMDTSMIIRPGDRLYVPVLPTSTPSPTVTPTRRVIVYPTATEEPDDSKDDPPPTQPPPTNAPPTNPPPTQRPSATNPPPTATRPPTQPPPPTVVPPTETQPPVPPGDNSDSSGIDGEGLDDDLLDLIESLVPPVLQ